MVQILKISASVLLMCACVVAQAPNLPRGTTVEELNHKIFVDGTHYPATAAGINQAISDAVTTGSREVYLPCGTTSINATLQLTGGAALIGCASGRNQTVSSPTTLLQWTGSSGQDMVEVCGSYPCGGSSTRSDGVLLRNMILDGGGTARYDLIVAENDTTRIENIRVRNAATAAFYAADATGLVLTNFDCGNNATYCMVLDWGTGGFVGNGIAIENDSFNATAPVLLIQGLSNNIKITGLQIDDDPTTFVGFVEIAGLDANSTFAGAVAGGIGAPNVVSIDAASFHAAGGGVPTQGNHSDVLLTAASSSNVPHNILFSNCYFNEASANAIEVAFGTGVDVSNCNSLNHTTTTVLASSNASLVSMFLVASTDTARGSGAGAGIVMDLTQNSVGSLQNQVAGFSGTSFNFIEATAPSTSSGNDICYGDSTAHKIECSLNNGSFFVLPLVGTANSWTATQSFGAGDLLPSAAGGTDVGSASLPFGNIWLGGAATNNAKLTGTFTGARIVTFPDVTGTISYPVFQDCTTTAACANTVKTNWFIVRGDVTFASASTVSLSQLPFTSSSSYSCTASDLTTAAGIVNATTYTSGAAVTFTETNGTNTDHARYICTGF